jgi:hypothetical protein
LVGGPYDGVTLNLEPATVEQIVFRSTDYFPHGPRELLYRYSGGAWRFVPDGQSELIRRVQEQDATIARLDREVNELIGRR